jgi:hypothetical protein
MAMEAAAPPAAAFAAVFPLCDDDELEGVIPDDEAEEVLLFGSPVEVG